MNEDTYLKDSIKKCVDYVMSKKDEDKKRIITGMFQYNDYLINEQLVIKALNDEEKQEWFNNEIFETKDKEIKRLKEEIKGYKQERERVLNIIDERNHKAIEYLESYNTDFKNCRFGEAPISIRELGDLLDILKGEDKE